MNYRFRIQIVTAWLCCATFTPALAQRGAEDIDSLIRQGVSQIDRRDFSAAEATFESVLELDPDNVLAIYELAYTHVLGGDSEHGLEIIDDALARGIDAPADFYSLSASVLDNLGRPQEAVRRFEDGIADFPDSHMLHLNLGVTQGRLGERLAAKASFEQAIRLQPEHPSAHFYLGQIYATEGQTAAAILALGTSLGFDNQRQRMATSTNLIKSIMDSRVQTLEDGTPLVVVSPEAMLPAESLEQFSSSLGTWVGSAIALQRKSDSDLSYEAYAIAYSLIVTAFVQAEIDSDSHFAADQYFRFYAPMTENGHQMTFSHLILASLNPELASAWVQENSESIEAFRAWTRSR